MNMSQCNICRFSIDVRNESITHQLSDNKNHYLFRATESSKLDYRTSEFTIEKATNGDECNWTLLSQEKVSGKCQTVFQTEEFIYLISRQQYQEPLDLGYSKHKLYKISKVNGKVDELYEWNRGDSFIRGMHFNSIGNGYVFFRPSGNPMDYQLFTTDNGGREWKSYDIKMPVGKTQSKDECLYFLSYKRNNENNLIYSIEQKSKKLDSLQFELNITDFKVGKKADYWLLGQDGDKTVLQHYKDGISTEVKAFSEDEDFFPDRLYKYNDVIVVLASKIDKKMLGGFGGTIPKMYLSRDNGLSWMNHPLDEALYVKPVSFYRDEQMIAHIGDGKILTCNLK